MKFLVRARLAQPAALLRLSGNNLQVALATEPSGNGRVSAVVKKDMLVGVRRFVASDLQAATPDLELSCDAGKLLSFVEQNRDGVCRFVLKVSGQVDGMPTEATAVFTECVCAPATGGAVYIFHCGIRHPDSTSIMDANGDVEYGEHWLLAGSTPEQLLEVMGLLRGWPDGTTVTMYGILEAEEVIPDTFPAEVQYITVARK